jgi:hypothetical protein
MVVGRDIGGECSESRRAMQPRREGSASDERQPSGKERSDAERRRVTAR